MIEKREARYKEIRMMLANKIYKYVLGDNIYSNQNDNEDLVASYFAEKLVVSWVNYISRKNPKDKLDIANALYKEVTGEELVAEI